VVLVIVVVVLVMVEQTYSTVCGHLHIVLSANGSHNPNARPKVSRLT